MKQSNEEIVQQPQFEQTTIKIPQHINKALDRWKAETGMPKATAIVEALEVYLEAKVEETGYDLFRASVQG